MLVNEIVWCYSSPSNTNSNFPKKHDTILIYALGKDYMFNSCKVRIPYKSLNHGGSHFGNGLNDSNISGYLKKGKMIEDWWVDISPVGRLKFERLGYPTQKPIKLINRLLDAFTEKGSCVADYFAGSGTTAAACYRRGLDCFSFDTNERAIQMLDNRILKIKGLKNDKNGS